MYKTAQIGQIYSTRTVFDAESIGTSPVVIIHKIMKNNSVKETQLNNTFKKFSKFSEYKVCRKG